MLKRLLLITLVAVGIIGGGLTVAYIQNQAVSAVSVADFDPGNIISDAVFYDKDSMNASQIQSFLNAKVKNCDTQGSLPYLDTGKTVKEYWTPLGEPAPYTCLKDFKQKSPEMIGSSGICGYIPGFSSRSAANIINDVAKACGISPKVLLVLLQKEQSLVTDNSPLRLQYRDATGMGCPDTAPCDPQYNGFFNQVYGAAYQYKLYRANPNNYNHVAGRNNRVLYHPDASCGGSIIYIKSQATAGLYNYTPYQPNSTSMNSYPGEGNSCSSYGNRNFWFLFTNWFGSTTTAHLPYAIRYDTSTDKTGDQGRIGFGLHKRPSSSVTLTFAVSSPSNAHIVGSNKVTITRDTWNQPDKNIITVAGKDNRNLTGSFQYWLVATERPITKDINYKNLSPEFIPKVEFIQNDSSSKRTVYRVKNSSLQQHTFTANLARVNELRSAGWVTENSGFEYCSTGEQSIVRLKKGNQYKLAIQNSKSLNTDLANGYQVEDIGLSTSSQGDVPVYYMYNDSDPNNIRSLYVTDKSEVSSDPAWKSGGVAFYGCRSDSTSVYRLYKPGGSHLYTASPRERDKAIYDLKYRYEGLGFYTCTGSANQPVHRFIKASTGVRFYTASEREKQKVVSKLKDYRYEGVAFRLCDNGNTDVYRHYQRSTGHRFFTIRKSESNNAVKQHGYTYEGIGFTSL